MKDIVATMISGKVLCGSFGLYPSYVNNSLDYTSGANLRYVL